MNIKKNYNFKKNNKIIYNKWIKKKYFNSYYNKKKKSFYLLLPPPNITGDLHIGHILNYTILDILARKYKMLGYNVCWIPGTDHASIATEIKIIKLLKNKGININNLSKKKIYKIFLKWSNKYKKIIISQLKNIGCSCDWNREQFTMDKNNYKSVINIFIKLYKKGMIYKKKKIVNWDIYAKTTISDEEIIYKKKKNYLYYIKYFTEDKKNYLIITTTRPETIFGDIAVCINPTDKRYIKIINNNNKKLIIPIVNRLIPIIMDKSIDKEFGTGCVKITPAHSYEDFNIYKKNKYKLKNIINIFNKDGTLNKNCMFLKGKDIFYARKKICKILNKLGFLIKKKKIFSNIAFSDRTNTIIENRLSNQWFLKMNKFIKPTLKKIKNIKIYPINKYNNLFLKWINNIKDWNISRQLNWGHKIPIFYYKKNKIVANNFKKVIKIIKNKYKKKKINLNLIKQDNNVLDTWFSSWILPISVLNGINKPNNIDFNYFFPINILVTGHDILFFWVLRMIMFSIFFIKKIPFKKIYFTGIVRDNFKKKISKSLGNYKNLYFLLNKYGADVLRIGILNINNEYDFIFDEKMLIKGRNFINKIWNAFNLIINNKVKKNKKKNNNKIIIKWFNNILNYKIYKLNNYLNNYKFHKSYILIYKLFKKNFCSIYLEYFKKKNNNNFKKKTLHYFYILLKILHPYIPFITEYINNILNKKFKLNNKDIIISKWPKNKKLKFNKKIINKFNNTFLLIKYLKKIKFIKKKNNIYIKKKYKKKIKKIIYIKLINELSFIKKIKFKKKIKNNYILFFYKKIKFFILKKNIIILNEKNNIYNKILFYNKYLLKIKKKIKNKKFLLLAPKKIIKLEKKKKKDIKKKLLLLKKKYFNY
ncbi:MAG: valine--tRNA ligase [Candidatus Shikimatogenerans bostrichidophilus]|nr:MAG: valine--tRNA ligase [Candidatus Shikimatogenerans bostrichidophilus]